MKMLWKEVSITKHGIEKLKYQDYIAYRPIKKYAQYLSITTSSWFSYFTNEDVL